jgi:hypothetical protein
MLLAAYKEMVGWLAFPEWANAMSVGICGFSRYSGGCDTTMATRIHVSCTTILRVGLTAGLLELGNSKCRHIYHMRNALHNLGGADFSHSITNQATQKHSTKAHRDFFFLAYRHSARVQTNQFAMAAKGTSTDTHDTAQAD